MVNRIFQGIFLLGNRKRIRCRWNRRPEAAKIGIFFLPELDPVFAAYEGLVLKNLIRTTYSAIIGKN